MANYEANFELNRNTLEFQGEVLQNHLHADLIIDYRPSKTSQLINDSGYITLADVPTKLSQLANDTGFITATALIPLENNIIEIENDIVALQNNKVDKVTGKGLSTNDFSNSYKTKLEGIEAGAQVNKVNSVNEQVGNVTITIPTKTSDLTNDSNFATVSQIPTNNNQLVNGAGYITTASLPTKLSDLTNDTGFITNSVNNLTNYYLKTETYTKQEVNQLIANIPKFEIQIVQALPQTGEAMVLYLVPKVSTAPDVYDEYIWIETSENFELIGTTAVDLTGYATEQWVTNQGYITSFDLTNYVTLNTSQKIQAAKAIFGNDVAFGSDTTQKNLLAVISNSNSIAGNWIGRLAVGAKNKTFIMGTYGDICVLGAHAWTNAQEGTGAAWEPVYINPDGDKAVYIGGSPINGKQPLMILQNVNANTTGTVKINRSTNLSNNFKDVACWGDNISKFNNDANYTSVVETTVSDWGFTKNTGTVTSVNNVSPVNGNVTLFIPDTSNMQTTNNLVTSISGLSTDTQYPSAKCVYDIVGNIETILASI